MQRFRIAAIAHISSLFVSNSTSLRRNITLLLCSILSFYLASSNSFLGNYEVADAAGLSSGAVGTLDNSGTAKRGNQKIAECVMVFGVCVLNVPNSPVNVPTVPIVPTSNQPKSNIPAQIENFSPIQVDSFGGNWELKSCSRIQNKVKCAFSVSSNGDITDGIYLPQTKMVDAEGNEYFASFTQIGNRKASSAGGGNPGIYISMTQGASYEIIIEFVGIPKAIPQVILFQVSSSWNGINTSILKYRNVPIASTPGISISSNQASNFTAIQVDSFGAAWELKSCSRVQNKVRCVFSISANEEITDGIYLSQTKMVDANGNEYFAGFTQIGNKKASSSGGGNPGIYIKMAKNVSYETDIEFLSIPTSVSQVVLLQVSSSWNGINTSILKYRSVPIGYSSDTK